MFAPFSADIDSVDRPEQAWMLNLRVTDLDAMIAPLNAAGVAAETRAEWDGPAGRFARLRNPEGDPIELWEPAPV